MHSIAAICGSIFSGVTLILAALHVYWALGGRWGSGATLPTIEGRRTLNPTPLGTAAVAALLALSAATICGKAGMFATGRYSAYLGDGSWGVCGVFLLRAVGNFKTFGFFKRVRGTDFADWDTRLYSPLCLALGVLAGVVAAARR
jgi:uncharacterized protein DUF3995